jgi:hypothetical protein
MKEWQIGMQPHSHKKHKSILCVDGEEEGKLQNEQEKWIMELYGNDPLQALMIQKQLLLTQNPCTDLEGPFQGNSEQRQNRQWNRKFCNSIFKLFTDCKTTELIASITNGSYISYTLNILRHKINTADSMKTCMCLRTIPNNSRIYYEDFVKRQWESW